MSTRASLLFPAVEHPAAAPERAGEIEVPKRPAWDANRFAREQIQRLVRQIFFPGWPKPSRHIVITAVDRDADVAGLCYQVGEALSNQVPCRIGVVEASLKATEFGEVFGLKSGHRGGEEPGPHRGYHQVSSHLWLVPPTEFWQGPEEQFSIMALENTVAQLRRDFDYTILHAPPAGLSSEAGVLGHLSDGVVLVLEAHSTRRLMAQRVKESLQAANVRVLGVVLSGRTFPIPEGIYKRL